MELETNPTTTMTTFTNYKRSGKMFAASLAHFSDRICKKCQKPKSASTPSTLFQELNSGEISQEEFNAQSECHYEMYQCKCAQ